MAQHTLSVFDLTGKEAGSIELNPAVFGVTPNKNLIHQAIVALLANSRSAIAHTKDRGEVAGSNRKPWRQKGTGNARHGSSQSPIWSGGGITFGPRNTRNFSVRLPQKMRQGAMKSALSMKLADGAIVVVDSLDKLGGKTKEWTAAASQLPINGRSVVIVDSELRDNAKRSINNVPKHTYVSVDSLTIFDATRAQTLIMTKDAVESLTKRLTKTEAVTAEAA